MVFPVFFHHLPDLLRRTVPPAALSVAESPQGRNVASAYKLPKLPHNIVGRLPRNQIQFEIRRPGRDPQGAPVCVTDVKNNPGRRIHEDAQSALPVQNQKVMRPIQGMLVLGVLRVVRTVALVDPPPLIDAPHRLPETVNDLLFLHFTGERILLIRKPSVFPLFRLWFT